jgi:hypothetical protein
MTRRAARMFLGAGALLGTVALVAVAFAVLVPYKFTHGPLVPIANAATLPQGVPARFVSSELVGLDVRAERLRGGGWAGGNRLNTTKALPIFLIRDGDDVRGFIGVDPRNRCEIELLPARTLAWGSFPAMLHDMCHGSIYDFSGEHIGGPSPWSLDELVLTVSDGRVYARIDTVIPGHVTR